MVGVPVRREQVAYAIRRGMSQRRSCTLLSVSRSALGYRSVKDTKDAPVLGRMTALAAQYPRFGYRRIRIFLDREGHAMSWGRCYRLWRPAAAPCADRGQPGVVLRLRVRLVREWAAAQVPDRHRRMDQGGAGDRGRWPPSLRPRYRGPVAPDQRARRAALSALRQWAGVRRPCAAEVDHRAGHRDGADRPRQALAEWRRRELQR